jgi:diguanylate cyclase (GGDEF)-like protein
LARSFFGQKVGVAFVEQTLYLHSTARLEKDLIYKIKEKVLEVLQEPAQIKECKLLQEGQEQTKNLCSYILSPLQQRQKSIGVLGVFNEGSRAYTFSDRKVFSLLCATVSQHLIRATLFQRVKEEAEQDPLTGVYNIKYFKEILEREFARAKRYRRPLSLIMLDFDHLKEFNDRFGHPEGSRLIKLVASCIKKNVRAQDYVARYGGDEFIMLLPETGVEGAKVVAERIRALIKSVSPHRGSASFGLAEAESAKDPMTLLSMADKALYQAKSEGRDMVCVWRRELEQAPSHEVTQILD